MHAGHAGQDSCGLAHVRLCQVCQGSGIQTEVYEYRRLEVRASHCSCCALIVQAQSWALCWQNCCGGATVYFVVCRGPHMLEYLMPELSN